MGLHLEFPWKLEHPPEASDVQWALILVIGAAVLVWLLAKYIVPSMISPYLIERQKNIADAKAQVDATMRETEQMRNDYRERLARIEDETARHMQEAIEEARTLRESILSEARHNADAIVRRGMEEIERERAKAMLSLRAQFVEDVISAAEYAAARSLGGGEQRRLVDEFVQNVGARS